MSVFELKVIRGHRSSIPMGVKCKITLGRSNPNSVIKTEKRSWGMAWTDDVWQWVSRACVSDAVIVNCVSRSYPWKCKSGKWDSLFVLEQSQCQIKQRVGRLEHSFPWLHWILVCCLTGLNVLYPAFWTLRMEWGKGQAIKEGCVVRKWQDLCFAFENNGFLKKYKIRSIKWKEYGPGFNS